MSLRLVVLIIMLPITAIIMFDLMSDKNVQSLVTYYSSQMCPQNANNQNTNSFLKYVQFACNIGFKDPLLLIVTLSLIVIALFILTTLYKVNRDRRYFLD